MHPDWIIDAVIVRAEALLALNALFLNDRARDLHHIRYFTTTNMVADSWIWFVEVYRRHPLEREIRALEGMSSFSLTLTGPQMVELLGIGRVCVTPGGSELVELPDALRIHFLVPVLAEVVSSRQRRGLQTH